jgi:hypothetical protein
MTPGSLDFVFRDNVPFTRIIRLQNRVTRTPLDLTGATARMQVRAQPGRGHLLLDLSTENGGITISPVEGVVRLDIALSAIAALTWNRGYYDLLVMLSDNVPMPILAGEFRRERGVTYLD